MKKILLILAVAVFGVVSVNAQTAKEVEATQRKMMAASTPCNGAPEAFKTFIAKFATDSTFMAERIMLSDEQSEKYGELLVPSTFTIVTPYDKEGDGELYYQSWGELQYNKVYLSCGWVDSYDEHTFEFTRQKGGYWYLTKIVPGE